MLWRRWRVWYGYNLYLIWKHYSTYTSNSTHFCGLTLPVGYNSLQVIKSRCAKSIIALMKLLVNNLILQTIKKKLYIEMHLLLCATSPESTFFLSFFFPGYKFIVVTTAITNSSRLLEALLGNQVWSLEDMMDRNWDIPADTGRCSPCSLQHYSWNLFTKGVWRRNNCKHV